MASSARTCRASGRPGFLSRTALCGALYGLALVPATAWAELTPPVSSIPLNPVGGLAQVNAGGGLPTIVQTETSTTVDLNAPRTIIDWQSYNLGADNSVTYQFDARDWIVVNRINGLQTSKIEGTIEGRVGNAFGGNIWFVSNSSIVFGKGAKIDAGGILAAVGTLDAQGFLDPANNLFRIVGGDNLPGAKVMALANSAITAHGGPLVFAGPSLVTRANAVVTAVDGGSVLYGGAKTFQIRMAPGIGGDFDLVDFIVPQGGGTDEQVIMDLAGSTRGNSVFVAAVARGAISSAVVNLEGLITAQAARADGGDIILSGGGGIMARQPGPTVADAPPTDLYLSQAVASRDLTVKQHGRIIANPWPRPKEAAEDPPSLQDDVDAEFECDMHYGCYDYDDGGYYDGYDPCYYDGSCLAGQENDATLLSALFDPRRIQNLTAGRDAKFAATASIELGRVTAGRDATVEAPTLRGNSLIAGSLNVRATGGDVMLSGVGVQGESQITATHDVRIDAIGATRPLSIQAGNDIFLGDGTSSVAGAISLDAAHNVTLELASARIDTLRAGHTANLRGGGLEVGSVTAPRLFAQAASINIGTATSTGDIYVIATSGDAIVGTANSGDDIYVLATNGAASLGQATLGGGPDGVSFDFFGSPDAGGNGRVVRVESSNGDARLGLGAGRVTGATAVTVKAGRDAAVDVSAALPAAFQIEGTRDVTLRAPTVNLESVTSGRDLTIGSSTGDFTVTQSLTATRNIIITAAGALTVASVQANAGSISLTGASVTAGGVSASEDLILKALSGGVSTTSFQAGRDLIVQGASLTLGGAISSAARDLSISTTGNFTANSNLTAGRNLSVSVGGTGSFQGLTASTGNVQIAGGAITTGTITASSLLAVDVTGKATLGAASAANVRVLAGDLDITGVVSAPTVQIEARTGNLRLGGAGGDTGGSLSLDNAEFGRLRVSGELRLYAGSTTGAARGDLTVQDLAVTPANTPRVTLLAGSERNVLVQGVAAPVSNGGVFRIGDATNLSWRPGSILISGSLGAASFSNGLYSNVRTFDEVRLAAAQDILMGSQRFIGLVQAAQPGEIDISNAKPAGVTPTAAEQFKVFVAAGRLEVSAENKVVQQNTSPLIGQAVGIFLSGQFTPSLIIDPPKIVDLYGALAGPGGQVTTGQAANQGLTFTVLDTSGNPISQPANTTYRFNSCDVGTDQCAAGIGGGAVGGAVSGDTNAGALTTRDALATISGGDAEEKLQAEVSSESITAPPVLLGAAPPDSGEIMTDPVAAGAGSEEIWRESRRTRND